jgi:hypothetical protein
VIAKKERKRMAESAGVSPRELQTDLDYAIKQLERAELHVPLQAVASLDCIGRALDALRRVRRKQAEAETSTREPTND